MQNECSFVSLRDVERAMIVFEYFYDKMAMFAPLINEKAIKEYKELHGSDKVNLVCSVVTNVTVQNA